MIDDRVIVDVLRATQNEKAFERERRAFTFQRSIRLVAHETATQAEAASGHGAGAILMDLQRADMRSFVRLAFELRVIDDGTFAGDNLRHRVREVASGAGERLDDRDLSC